MTSPQRQRIPVSSSDGTLAQLDAIRRHVPQAELLVLENCRHVPQQEQPQALLDACMRFLRSL
ncbi:alpha/beta fold hydrolase [Noviherbaspirillum sedimenti]|uniref:Alpha/beta hydrolase n=1 Tax=Noviherbaspirillum sedimenti TaxID=2320865 RepID=A0A3A3G1B9_9BURK|nr:alpha/beta hydrolase [Noviherbaspirillum sedimenti]RJG01425.1 hypothetical protein D3878_07365 [Noviherbaspirillum sedimenti]